MAAAVKAPKPYLVYNFTVEGIWPQDIKCTCCDGTWTRPLMLLPCEHIFCRACVEAHANCPKCEALITSWAQPPRQLVEIAEAVRVKCECGLTMTRGQSYSHSCIPRREIKAAPQGQPMPKPNDTTNAGQRRPQEAPPQPQPEQAHDVPPPRQSKTSRAGDQITAAYITLEGCADHLRFGTVPHFCNAECTKTTSIRLPRMNPLFFAQETRTGTWRAVDPAHVDRESSRAFVKCESCGSSEVRPTIVGDAALGASDNRTCVFHNAEKKDKCVGMPFTFRGCEHALCAEHMRKMLGSLFNEAKADGLHRAIRPMLYVEGPDALHRHSYWGIACPCCLAADRKGPSVGVVPTDYLMHFAIPAVAKEYLEKTIPVFVSSLKLRGYCASCGVVTASDGTCRNCDAVPCAVCHQSSASYCLHSKSAPTAAAWDAIASTLVMAHLHVRCTNCNHTCVSIPDSMFEVGQVPDDGVIAAACPRCGGQSCAICGGDGTKCKDKGNMYHTAFTLAYRKAASMGLTAANALYVSRVLLIMHALERAVPSTAAWRRVKETWLRQPCCLLDKVSLMLGEDPASLNAILNGLSCLDHHGTWSAWMEAVRAARASLGAGEPHVQRLVKSLLDKDGRG